MMLYAKPVLFACILLASARFSLQAQGSQPSGWQQVPIAPMSDRPRVLVIYDMEGLAGVDRFELTNCKADSSAYLQGREHLARDVNAVVEGLLAGGATEVSVIDRHGSGCDTEPDLPLSKLHPKAHFLDESSGNATELPWDAVALVGMHAGGGSGGFLAHTGTFGGERIVNGVSVNESDIFAMRFGARGIPIIFASGDDYLHRQISERLPWVSYVEVKRATTPAKAELRPLDQVRAELRDRAKFALEHRPRAKAIRLVPPFTGGFRPLPPLQIQPLVDVPGIVIRDSVVTFSAASVPELMRGIARIYDVLSDVAENDTWWIVNRNQPDVMTSYRSLYIQRWLDGEAARRPPKR